MSENTDPRLGEIEARLAAATPGPWEIDSIESGEHGVFAEQHHRLGCGTSQVAGFMTKANAELLVNAPADVAYLLAELRKRDERLDEYVARFGEHTNDSQGRNCPACNAQIRVKRRAAAATGGGE